MKQAERDLGSNQIQPARKELGPPASEADIQAAEIPLATYAAAIKAVAPLIYSGKIDDAMLRSILW